MTTVEYEKQLDLERMGIEKNHSYNNEELEAIATIGRIVRNMELMKRVIGINEHSQ